MPNKRNVIFSGWNILTVMIISVFTQRLKHNLTYLFDRIHEFINKVAHPTPVDFWPKDSPNLHRPSLVEVTYEVARLTICHLHLHLNLCHVLGRNVVVVTKVRALYFNDNSLLQFLIVFHDTIRCSTHLLVLWVENKAAWFNDITSYVLLNLSDREAHT